MTMTRDLQRLRAANVTAMAFRSQPMRIKAEANGATRKFEGSAYNGGFMFPTLIVGENTITGPVVVDLDSLTIPSQNRPVLDDHDDSTDGLIGRTTYLKVEGYSLQVNGVIYTKKLRAQKILSANDGGHSWQLSVGLDNFVIERVPTGQTSRVNGQDFAGPFTLCRNAYLTDISFVSLGGDDTTWASIAARRMANYYDGLSARSLIANPAVIGRMVADAMSRETHRCNTIMARFKHNTRLQAVAIKEGWDVEHLEQKAIHWNCTRGGEKYPDASSTDRMRYEIACGR